MENEFNNMLNVKELGEYLKIKPRTIYSWVKKNQIPYYKLGNANTNGALRFKKEEIDEWLNKSHNKVDTNNPVPILTNNDNSEIDNQTDNNDNNITENVD